MRPEIGETIEHQQSSRPRPDLLTLERPGVLVRHEDGVQARLKRRVDVGFRAVADHPRAGRVHAASIDQRAGRRRVLLVHNGGVGEARAQAGAVDLELLFLRVPFCEKREVVAAGEIIERLGNALDHLHRAFQDLLGEPEDHPEIVLPDLALGEVPVALLEVAPEIGGAVAMELRVGGFHFVEDVANLVGPERGVIQVIDEVVEGALEVDVVFPERVVGVDDQELSVHWADLGASRKGISKTASTSTGSPPRRAGSNCHLARDSIALASSRSSRWRRSFTASMPPSLRMMAPRRTIPCTPSATAEATYFGSTLRTGEGARISPATDFCRSANQISQLPEYEVTFGIWMATV